MKRHILLVVLLAGGLAAIGAQPEPAPDQRKIALTFNEVPYMKPHGFWRPREVSSLILKTLEAEGVQATGFVVQEKAEDDPAGYIILDDWVSRGHTLGNQTWGDIDFNQVGHEDFLEHAVDGQKYLKQLSRKYEFDFRWMRFPLLHEGNEPKKKRKVRKALDRARYKIAHVSVKTSDFAFNPAYLEVQGDSARIEWIKEAYLDHVNEALDYSERQSQLVFGRNIAHVLQLHTGIATATFLPDLIKLLRQRGYELITMQEALQDPAYQTEEEYVGPLGLTFIDRVAATRGLPFNESAGELDRADVERALKRLQP